MAKDDAGAAAEAAAPVEPKLADSIGLRAELGADDGDAEATKPAAGAAGAAPVGGQEGADAPPSAEQTAETAEAIATALPELTPAQVQALAENPDVVAAVLSGNTAQKTLNELFEEVLAEKQEEAAHKAQFEGRVTTLAEAIKRGQEEDDWGEFGRLTYQSLESQQAEKAEKGARDEVAQGVKGVVYTDLDSAIEQVYGDVLDTMTDAELSALDRSAFPSEAAYMVAVFGTLDSHRQEMVRSGVATLQAEEAQKIAGAAVQARAKVGIGALPGGTGVESPGDNIGSLIRAGLRDAFSEESD